MFLKYKNFHKNQIQAHDNQSFGFVKPLKLDCSFTMYLQKLYSDRERT